MALSRSWPSGQAVPRRDVRDHQRVDDWSALIPVIGTLAGALVGVRGALAISRMERRDALGGEMRRAYAAYLATIYSAVAELRDMPTRRPPSRTERLSERLSDRLLGEAGSWLLTRKRVRAAFGDRPGQLTDRVATAVAYLHVLPLPCQVREAVAAGNEYIIELAEERTAELKGQWPAVYSQLMAASKALEASPKRRWGIRVGRKRRFRRPWLRQSTDSGSGGR